jgi:hypothetical protein
MRATAAAAFGCATFLPGQRLLRWRRARKRALGLWFPPILLQLEAVDHARRHDDRGGEPGD